MLTPAVSVSGSRIFGGGAMSVSTTTSSKKQNSNTEERYGHLPRGEFRYMFAARRELGEVELSESSSSSESEKDDPDADAAKAMFSAVRDRQFTDKALNLANQGLQRLSKLGKSALGASKAALEVVEKTVRRTSEDESSSESDSVSSDGETPEWAKACGFRVLLTGTIPMEGLFVDRDLTPPLARDWAVYPHLMARVVSYLNPRSVARASMLSRGFHDAGSRVPLYVELVAVGSELRIDEAFPQRVDSVTSFGGAVLAAGDKRVEAFSVDSGVRLGDVGIRDTITITHLFVAAGRLWSASANGALREWTMPHDVTQIEFRAQLWEHTARINDVVDADRCVEFGGSVSSDPRLVSVSDDRTARVWNVMSRRCEAVLRPYSHRCATLRAVCVSDAHLFIGSSDGIVYVYAADSKTRKISNKTKSLIGVDAIFPLEHEIDLLDDDNVDDTGAVVVAIQVASRFGKFHDQLVVATWDAVRIFAIPKKTLDFQPLHVFKDHTDRITALLISQTHIISAADDATLRFYGRYHGDDYPHALERVVHLPGRIKCLHIEPAPSPDYTGTLVSGTSNGIVTIHYFGASL